MKSELTAVKIWPVRTTVIYTNISIMGLQSKLRNIRSQNVRISILSQLQQQTSPTGLQEPVYAVRLNETASSNKNTKTSIRHRIKRTGILNHIP